MGDPAVELVNVAKRFGDDGARIELFRGLSVSVAAGETLLLTGPSGSGKTTLLSIVALLEEVDEGELRLLGTTVSGAPLARRNELRSRLVGYAFQEHFFVDAMTVLENVLLPALPVCGWREAFERARTSSRSSVSRRCATTFRTPSRGERSSGSPSGAPS